MGGRAFQPANFHELRLFNNVTAKNRRARMTNEQLVTIARAHTKDLPKLSGETWASDENLKKVVVQDTVIVRFESDEHPNKVMILLEKDSGKFIGSWLMPQPPAKQAP
jgi:hypothetical protein